MTEQDVLSAIQEEVRQATEAFEQRQSNREHAADYFYARRPVPPEEDEQRMGMSSIVSTDVQDAVFAVQAELVPAFSGSSPVEFEPLDDSDEAQAGIETRAVNHVAQGAGLYMAVNQATMDVMLRRAGVVKVYWDSRFEVDYEDIDQVPYAMLPQMLSLRPGEVDIEVVDHEDHPDLGTVSGTLKRVRLVSEPRLEAVPLDEFLVSGNLQCPDLSQARFTAHRRPISRSDLVKMGLDVDTVYELKDVTSTRHRQTEARKRTTTDREYRTGHESTEFVMVCESYYQLDVDGDGIAELRRIVTAGGSDGVDEVLLNDPVNEDPFALGVGYLGIFSWDGVSLYDRLRMLQDVKTDLIRELRNTAKRNLRQRIGAVENDAELDDVFASQMGGIIRLKTPNGVVPIPEVQIPPQLFQLLEYLDTMRNDKGGAAIDATQSAQVLGQGGDWSLERVMAATEQINAMVAKNICETMVKTIFRKLHTLLRSYKEGDVAVPGSTGWERTVPQQWSPRKDMVISLGMSVGERSMRSQALGSIIQTQTQDEQAGKSGILFDLNAQYQARVDLARMAGLPNPEQYWLNPASPESQQAQQAAQQSQQMAMAQQQQQQQETMRFQYQLMTDIERVKNEGKLQQEQMRQMFQQMQAEMTNAIKLFGERVKLAEIEQKGDQAEAQVEIDRLQAVRSASNA